MDTQNYDEILIHQEFIRREASIHLALKQSGLIDPPLFSRVLPNLGEMLIRVGTRLKQHSYHKLSSEEATAPTFLIIL